MLADRIPHTPKTKIWSSRGWVWGNILYSMCIGSAITTWCFNSHTTLKSGDHPMPASIHPDLKNAEAICMAVSHIHTRCSMNIFCWRPFWQAFDVKILRKLWIKSRGNIPLIRMSRQFSTSIGRIIHNT